VPCELLESPGCETRVFPILYRWQALSLNRMKGRLEIICGKEEQVPAESESQLNARLHSEALQLHIDTGVSVGLSVASYACMLCGYPAFCAGLLKCGALHMLALVALIYFDIPVRVVHTGWASRRNILC
jgi:hypothetical protein